MKDNFLLKTTIISVVETLSDEEAGQLFKGILRYTNNQDTQLTGLLNAVFIPIKTEIDKNEDYYRKVCEKNKMNGAKGGAPKGNSNAKKTFTDDTSLLGEIEEQPKTTQNNRTVEKTAKNNPKQRDARHISYITNHKSYNHNSNINKDIIKNIIDYLNNKTKSKFKYNTRITQEKINARLNEGYTLDDFIAVIDKKTEEWTDTKFEKYLCPETLFGQKFEKYLNQKQKKTPTWFNKKIEKKEMEETDRKELDSLLESFKGD